MSAPDRLRRLRLVALSLGAVELPFTLLFAVAGAGFYGSPFSEVTPEGVPIVAAYLILGGPLGLLPLAILSFWMPRVAGAAILAGGACAAMLAIHPWGLQYAVPHLYTDVGPVFAPVALVTMIIGLTMVVVDGTDRRLVEAIVVGAFALFVTYSALARTETRELHSPFRTLHPIRFLAFGPDSRTLIAEGRTMLERASPTSLSTVDAETGAVTVIAEGTSQIVLSPDRATMATVTPHGTAFWDTKALRLRSSWDRASGPVAISGAYAAIALPGGLQLVNLERGGNQRFIRYDSGSSWFAWSPDGGLLAIGPGAGGDILLFDPRTRDLGALSIPGDEARTAGRFSPDGNLAVLLEDGPAARVLVLSVPYGREIHEIEERAAWNADWFSPDGRTLVTTSLDESVVPPASRLTLWDTTTWDRKATLAAWSSYAFSPDGAFIATLESSALGATDRVVLRRTSDGTQLRELGTVTVPVTVVAYSPDGTRVAVGGDGEFVQGAARGDIRVFSTGTR